MKFYRVSKAKFPAVFSQKSEGDEVRSQSTPEWSSPLAYKLWEEGVYCNAMKECMIT